MCGADIYSVIYLCSCRCCSKLRVSLQKSWQLAGLLAKTLAFGGRREIGTDDWVQDNNHGNNGYKLFHYCCITAELIIRKFPNDITECYAKQPFGLREEDRYKLIYTVYIYAV